MARISPVFGFMTIAVAPFAWYCRAAAESACSVFPWIAASIVVWMSSPTLALLIVSIRSGRPTASWTTSCSPFQPPSTLFSECSRPVSPWLSVPTAPITCEASSPCG
jgi:hypothetical protein